MDTSPRSTDDEESIPLPITDIITPGSYQVTKMAGVANEMLARVEDNLLADSADSSSSLLHVPQAPPTLLKTARLITVGIATLVGLQSIYLFFLTCGSLAPSPEVLSQLTITGRALYAPERELFLYVIGSLLTLIFGMICSKVFNRRLQHLLPSNTSGYLTAHCLAFVTWGMVSTLLSLSLFLNYQDQTGKSLFGIGMSAALILLITLPLLAFAIDLPHYLQMTSLIKWLATSIRINSNKPVEREQEVGLRWSFYDLIVPILVCILIVIPDCSRLAGAIFLHDRFHHWDYFAMGPTLGYLRGRALGTETYAQYGVGWPMLFAHLSPLLPVGYGNALRIATLTGCLYFTGVYFFLRVVLKSVSWAIAGVFLALYFQQFSGFSAASSTLWQWPSSTIMRSPWDIWFFLCLWLHLRSNRGLALAGLGVLVGLSVLFETDTGIYLAGTLLAYLFIRSCLKSKGSILPPTARWPSQMAVALSAMAGVILIGLAFASRGTLFSSEFLHGWLEALILYPSGVSMLPISQFPLGITLSFCIIGIYLFTLACFWSERREPLRMPQRILTACIAIYGMGYLVQFIGRSHPANLFHSSVPFILLIVIVSQQVVLKAGFVNRSTFVKWKTHPRPILAAMPILTLLCGLFALNTNPNFTNYPSLLHPSLTSEPASECLFPTSNDVCFARQSQPFAQEFQTVAAEMQERVTQGQSVALISNSDTALTLASGTNPWLRYSPVMPTILKQSQLIQSNRILSEAGANVVFFQHELDDDLDFTLHPTDVWKGFQKTLNKVYRYHHRCGPFEVWERIRM